MHTEGKEKYLLRLEIFTANNHNHDKFIVLYCCGSWSLKITRLAFPSTGMVLLHRCRNSRGTTERMGWKGIGNIVEHTGDFGYLISKCFLHTFVEHFISSIWIRYFHRSLSYTEKIIGPLLKMYLGLLSGRTGSLWSFIDRKAFLSRFQIWKYSPAVVSSTECPDEH